MGFYINPQNSTKENWLKDNGTKLDHLPPTHIDGKGNIAVCLVDNGWMTAAGIAYSQDELDAFSGKHDSRAMRKREWYYVPIAKVLEVTPSVEKAIEESIE